MVRWSSQKKKECTFCNVYFDFKGYFFSFCLLSMERVLNKLSDYKISKNITSYAFFLVFNSFVSNTLFLYPLKTSENRKVLLCFQGVEKGCIGNKWVKIAKSLQLSFKLVSSICYILPKESISKIMNNAFYFI